jgi:uncharacterized protein (DUF342 family)
MADENKIYEFELKLSGDYYEAYLTIHILKDIEFIVTPEEIIDFLKSKNVIFGIDLDALDTICQNPRFANGTLIAKGIPHVHGENGEITFFVEQGNVTKPEMLANGKVDFKNLNLVHIAQKGDILAEKTEATEGTTGTTVTGKFIKQKPGKTVNFKLGKNVSVSEDGLKIYATATGTIKIDDDKINIIEVLEIRGDVGVKTGNILFHGKVVVFGNVITGYEIECDELEINGLVESATLKCSGDITISVGIQGNDAAYVECGGNLKAQVLNNCHVKVKGDINCDTIMHSDIICDGEIRAAGRKGLIVGGEISARKSIRANTIGSEMGTTTSLKLGLDSQIMDEYKLLLEQLKEAKDQCTKLDQIVRLLTKNTQASPENQELADNLKRMTSARDQSYLVLNEKQEEHNKMLDLMNHLADSIVTATTFYPGVKVKIGNSFYNVKYELKNAKLLRESGVILAISN